MDPDAAVLEDAARAVTAIDLKYRRASFDEKRELKKDRDRAFTVYTMARRRLLEDGVLCGKADVEEMKGIRKEVSRARKVQSIIVAARRFVVFLARVLM
ncbi:MAG: hypothetical protein JW821_04550 [Deltaproteobacteria bacterium]|nr:hypothetical protein [Deltaproteobacteria bacterium]